MTPGNKRQVTAGLSLPTSRPAAQATAEGRNARRTRRFLRLCLLLLAGLFASGCGNGISGGSIPPGGAPLAGRVVMAADPTHPLANASVTVLASLSGQSAQTFVTTTDAQGAFSFAKIPTGPVRGDVFIDIEPNSTTVQPLKFSFSLTNKQPVTMLATVPPASFNVESGTSVKISPSLATIHVGDIVHFTAQLLDKSGQVLPVVPTLLFSGDIGTFTDDGTFTDTQTGSGSVVAYWYGGITSSTQIFSESKVTSRLSAAEP